jgi:pimeloyl-ACP methyl ester carboxylesterase
MQSPQLIAYPLAVDGVMTRVLEAHGGSEVVLFVHGVSARADRWRRNLQAVASGGFRAVAMDLPGHGFAQKGAGFNYSVCGYADFIEAFLDQNHIEKAHFVGTSLGAHILGTVICRQPALAQSFMLIGATGMFPIGQDACERIARSVSDQSCEGVRRKFGRVIHNPELITDATVEEEWRINNSPGAAESFEALAKYFRERLDRDVIGTRLCSKASHLHRIAVWGSEDVAVPPAIGHKVEATFGIRLVLIPGTSHCPYWEEPEKFNHLLMDFLRGP